MYYLLTDCILSLGYDEVRAIRSEIDSAEISNCSLLEMQKKMNEVYDQNLFQMNGDNVINKLSYKGSLHEKTPDGRLTNYGYLIKEFAGR